MGKLFKICCLGLIIMMTMQRCQSKKMRENKYFLLVGTYTDGNASEGIYVYDFDDTSGQMTEVAHTNHVVNPSYMALSENEKYLYAVNENTDDKTKGMISAFAFNDQTGQLDFLNTQPTNGDAPCYVSIDSLGKNVAEANYNGGNFSIYKTDTSGKLWPATQIIAHKGTSANKKIQTQSHVHSTIFSPDQKYLFVCDLGNDTLYQYPFKINNLLPVDEAGAIKYKIPAGYGPRHIAFSPNHKYAYLLNELDAQLMVYSWHNDSLSYLQTLVSTTVEDTANADKGASAIRVSPDGKFVYTSNRGKANDLTIFQVQPDGLLKEVAHQSTGPHPRDFIIDPTGHFLLVATRDDNTVRVYKRDATTGLLSETSQMITLPRPVALLFAQKNK
ncbi:lactonase family protein [Arachidicoccus ginsenosidivorans]|jgi:6-phosphogluconolactonase